MIFYWYKIYNRGVFQDSGLTSRSVQLYLEGLGLKTLLLTRGHGWGVVFDGVFLSIGLNDKNPFIFENKAIYLDVNDDIWIGVAV